MGKPRETSAEDTTAALDLLAFVERRIGAGGTYLATGELRQLEAQLDYVAGLGGATVPAKRLQRAKHSLDALLRPFQAKRSPRLVLLPHLMQHAPEPEMTPSPYGTVRVPADDDIDLGGAA